MKVVINKCYGGFQLSHKAMMRYFELKGINVRPYTLIPGFEMQYLSDEEVENQLYVGYEDDKGEIWSPESISRTDPALVQVVEELGEEANSFLSKLKVEEVPDNTEWRIEEYDGMESIEEEGRGE